MAGQILVQQSLNRYPNLLTGTTIIPADNTRPQSTEGDQYMIEDFVPKFDDSTLEIEVVVNGAYSAGSQFAIALFRGLDSDCKAAAGGYANGVNVMGSAVLKHFEPAGLAGTPIRFAVRAGCVTAGTFTFNGQSAAGLFNNTLSSYILVREWANYTGDEVLTA